MFRTITPAGLGLVCSAFFVAACGPPEVTAPSFVNAPFGAASRPRPDQRLREGARVFDILTVAEFDPAGRYLEIEAEEGIAA